MKATYKASTLGPHRFPQHDRIAIIVPNSKLVSQRCKLSYGDPRARIAIPVGVANDSDIKLVTDTLLEAAKDVE